DTTIFTLMIRPATIEDAKALAEIYNHFVEHTIVTFDEESVSTGFMEKKIGEVMADYPWIVWQEGGEIIGYAYADKWRLRKSYNQSVESTIYIKPGFEGKKIGSQLYSALLDTLKTSGRHVVIGGISLPNVASVALHEKLGFVKAAHFREVGFKFDKYIDVGYWQIIL